MYKNRSHTVEIGTSSAFCTKGTKEDFAGQFTVMKRTRAPTVSVSNCIHTVYVYVCTVFSAGLGGPFTNVLKQFVRGGGCFWDGKGEWQSTAVSARLSSSMTTIREAYLNTLKYILIELLGRLLLF